MIPIGKRDRRIVLQSPTTATDGDPTNLTWTTVDTVWARKTELTGAERFLSSQFAAQAEREYAIRYRTDIEPTWRVKDGDEEWNIAGTPEGDGRRRETRILVTRLDPNNQ